MRWFAAPSVVAAVLFGLDAAQGGHEMGPLLIATVASWVAAGLLAVRAGTAGALATSIAIGAALQTDLLQRAGTFEHGLSWTVYVATVISIGIVAAFLFQTTTVTGAESHALN